MSPKSASSTIFALPHRANDSVSGAVLCVPSRFICLNTGDSSSARRIHTETPSSTIDRRNGIRQPQASNASLPSASRQARITISERKSPSVAVVWIHDVNTPRFPCGACSATYVTAPPYSPPSASPCSRRSSTSATGAAMPICAYVGSTPTTKVAAPMMTIVMRKVCLRPTRSPSRPKTRAPKGRTAKPAAKASSAKMNAAVGFTAEKNCRLMITASEPYR